MFVITFYRGVKIINVHEVEHFLWVGGVGSKLDLVSTLKGRIILI